MSAPTDPAYVKLRRQFAAVLVIALVVVLGLAAVIEVANHGHHRPEGAAERWLAAVSDTTRKGVRADATRRAEKVGSLTIAAGLIPPKSDTDGMTAFADLEVGEAKVNGNTARVPFRLHERAKHGSNPLAVGTLVLQRSGPDWRVVSRDARRPGEKVPSEGGAAPSQAGAGLWIGAVLLGVVITVFASLLVEWASRSSQRATVTA